MRGGLYNPRPVDDVPVNGQLTHGVTSNWGFDHAAAGDAHAQGGHVLILGAGYDSIGQGTWVRQVGGWVTYHRLYNSTHADLDEVDYMAYLPAGTWTLRLYYGAEAVCGILDIDIDGVEVASEDTYVAVADKDKALTQTGIAVATSGLKAITCRVDGKNPASGNHFVSIAAIELWRTA